jgi:hypothetical protein
MAVRPAESRTRPRGGVRDALLLFAETFYVLPSCAMTWPLRAGPLLLGPNQQITRGTWFGGSALPSSRSARGSDVCCIAGRFHQHWPIARLSSAYPTDFSQHTGRPNERLGGRLHPADTPRPPTNDGMSSHAFDIGPGVSDGLPAVQRIFYYQRAFTRRAPKALVHASNAAPAPPDVAKRWHDAGDFFLYRASTNSALFWMLSAVADFGPQEDDTAIAESGNGCSTARRGAMGLECAEIC